MQVCFSKVRNHYWFIVLGVLLATCAEEEEKKRAFPQVRTLDVESITAEGALFRGEIRDNSHPITERGFVWSVNESYYGTQTIINLGPASGEGPFEAVVTHDLIPDRAYYVWAYAKTATHTVYGEIKAFWSLGSKSPVVHSFEPKEATWLDTLVIRGENFSLSVPNISVKANGLTFPLISTSLNEVKVRVPHDFHGPKGKVAVSVLNNIGFASDSIQLKAPIISSIEPLEGKPGHEVTIEGKYFHPKLSEVFFGEVEAEVISRSAGVIKCKVPEGLLSGALGLRVKSAEQFVESDLQFVVKAFEIEKIAPLLGTFGEPVTVTLKGLTPRRDEITVYFGPEQAEIISVSGHEIVVRAPYDLGASSEIRVTHAGNVMVFKDPFELVPPEIVSFDAVVDRAGDSFILRGKYFHPYGNNRVFIGGHDANVQTLSDNELRVFVPSDLEVHEALVELEVGGHIIAADDRLRVRWIAHQLPPSYFVNDGSVIHFHNGAVFKTLGNDFDPGFTSYEVSSQYLRKLKDFEGVPRMNSASFILNDNLYVVSGETAEYQKFNDVWMYEIAQNNWVRKNDFPFVLGWRKPIGFTHGGKGFVVHDNQVFQYEPGTDTWSVVNNDAPLPGMGAAGTVIGNLYYFQTTPSIGTILSKRYNLLLNSWEDIVQHHDPQPVRYAFEFQGQPVFGAFHYFNIYRPELQTWTEVDLDQEGLYLRFGFEHNSALNFLTSGQKFFRYSYRPYD